MTTTTTARPLCSSSSIRAFVAATLILALNGCIFIDGFNLENRLPIVKYGDADTYFGYSVASHITGEKDEPLNKKW